MTVWTGVGRIEKVAVRSDDEAVDSREVAPAVRGSGLTTIKPELAEP